MTGSHSADKGKGGSSTNTQNESNVTHETHHQQFHHGFIGGGGTA